MARLSAGLLLYRRGPGGVEVLLVHPGGPFWARRDAGAWSVPKGEHGADEDPRAAAEREFAEELGQPAPPGPRRALGALRQAGGKVVEAWAVAGDFDAAAVVSNTFEMEWPRRSGRIQRFPEVDRAAWYPLGEARHKLLASQRPFLDRLAELVAAAPGPDDPEVSFRPGDL